MHNFQISLSCRGFPFFFFETIYIPEPLKWCKRALNEINNFKNWLYCLHITEVSNIRINQKIRILSGYFNNPIQCGLNFLFWDLKNFLLFLHDLLAPLISINFFFYLYINHKYVIYVSCTFIAIPNILHQFKNAIFHAISISGCFLTSA